MTLAVAIQMDPIHSIDISGDSTFALALEAQARGYALYHYLPQHLWLSEGGPVATGARMAVGARVRRLTVRREPGNHADLGPAEAIDLSTMDVVLMRQDPPFDMGYISATHILEHLPPRTLVVNDPAHVRNAPEKLFVLQFPALMPPTLVTRDAEAIREFRARHGDIVVKPLFGNGGYGVFRLKPDDENLSALLEVFGSHSREPVMVQRYLPEVRAGDKRIILIEGEPAGGVMRVPAAGEARANLHVGGKAVAAELTPRDLDICAAIGPALRERGLLFVGIDVIGDYLTEINVTSPTGIQEIDRLNGVRLAARVWDAIEAKLKRRRAGE